MAVAREDFQIKSKAAYLPERLVAGAWSGLSLLVALIFVAGAVSCRQSQQGELPPPTSELGVKQTVFPTAGVSADPMALVLAPCGGEGRWDLEIGKLQARVRTAKNPELALEKLGWAFVGKARESFDPGYYKLAEMCGLALEQRQPSQPAALLLRGHALHNQHRFKEAEPLARELVAQRGQPFDYGLLGDVLMEQGRLREAVEAYQMMADLRPDSHSYTRAAHVRWLKGDVTGAASLMRMAVSAASPRDPESAAWVQTRLAAYQFQLGLTEEASHSCDEALVFEKRYPPALLLRGRMLLAKGEFAAAIGVLEQAARQNPLPEYQWALADGLRAAGRTNEAATVEADIMKGGALADPRSFALFLATRGKSPETAVKLAAGELESRDDVFTHDALAWALAGAGRWDEARAHLARALSEGTRDGRLFFHAAMIADKAGSPGEARDWLHKARELEGMLLPSEREQLLRLAGSRGTVAGQSERGAESTHFPPSRNGFAGVEQPPTK